MMAVRFCASVCMYIYIYVRTSVPRHASIIKERNKVSNTTKERNKVSIASAYYLEQRRARLIVDGISVKTDKTVKEGRGRATEKESRGRARVKES